MDERNGEPVLRAAFLRPIELLRQMDEVKLLDEDDDGDEVRDPPADADPLHGDVARSWGEDD